MALRKAKEPSPKFVSNSNTSMNTGRKTTFIQKQTNIFRNTETPDTSPGKLPKSRSEEETEDDTNQNKRRMPF